MESRAKVFLDLSPFSSEDVRNEFLRMLKAVKKKLINLPKLFAYPKYLKKFLSFEFIILFIVKYEMFSGSRTGSTASTYIKVRFSLQHYPLSRKFLPIRIVHKDKRPGVHR